MTISKQELKNQNKSQEIEEEKNKQKEVNSSIISNNIISEEQKEDGNNLGEKNSQIKKNLSKEKEVEVKADEESFSEENENTISTKVNKSNNEININNIPINLQKIPMAPPVNAKELVDKGRELLTNQAVRTAYNALKFQFIRNNGKFNSRNNGLKKEKGSSVSSKHLSDALTQAQTFFSLTKEETVPSYNEILNLAMLLSEAANAYYDDHRGWRGSSYGTDAKNLANEIRKITYDLFRAINQSEIQNGQADNQPDIDVEELTKPEKKKHIKIVEELDKHYKEWAKNYANNEALSDREKIRAKYVLFKQYEESLEIYKKIVKPKDQKEIIRQYDAYKLQNSVLDKAERQFPTLKQDEIATSMSDHAHKFMDKEEEKELDKEQVDAGLTKEQLEGIDKIDKWFMRNAFNGGLIGKISSARKSNFSDIIIQLFTKTKRERLFIYYLIETGKRKSPDLMSVYDSQNKDEYIPNLSEFKSQMLATRLKILTHVSDGDYTYMHKLCEAMQVNAQFKELIRDCPRTIHELENGGEEDDGNDLQLIIKGEQNDVNEEELEPEALLEKKVEDRKKQLAKTYRSLKSMEAAAKTLQNASRRNKDFARTEYERMREAAQAEIRKLAEADEAVGDAHDKYDVKAKEKMKPNLRGYNKVKDVNKSAGLGLKVAQTTFKYHDAFTSWGIPAEWKYMELFAGVDVGANLFSGISNLLGSFAAFYSLYTGGSKMHAGDIGEAIVNGLNSIANLGMTAAKGYIVGAQNLQFFKTAAEGVAAKTPEVLKTGGIVTAAVGMALGSYQVMSSTLDSINNIKASNYLDKKHKAIVNLPANEEKEVAEQKRNKEIKYEKNMIKLSGMVADKKGTSGILSTAGAGLGLISIFVPGIGPLICSVAGIMVTIASSRVEKLMGNDIRTNLFDDFFEFDKFAKSAVKALGKKGKVVYDLDRFKMDLRRRIAAAVGFTDVGTCADSIAKKYAKQVCSKLFAVPEVWESKNEQKGYIQLVKSFGLPYNKEKGLPDEGSLAKKISGR